MTEPFVSSRFLIREKPVAYPYYDLILQDSQGPVFDLNVDMNSYDGAVYLRFEHVEEMARTMGMATKEEVESLNEVIKDLRAQLYRLPKAQEELKSGLDDLTARFFASLNTVDSDSEPEPSVGNTESDEADFLNEPPTGETKRPLKL